MDGFAFMVGRELRDSGLIFWSVTFSVPRPVIGTFIGVVNACWNTTHGHTRPVSLESKHFSLCLITHVAPLLVGLLWCAYSLLLCWFVWFE